MQQENIYLLISAFFLAFTSCYMFFSYLNDIKKMKEIFKYPYE